MPQFFETMTAPAWSALVSSIALIFTIWFQVAEWRRSRFSRGIDTIAAMDTRFESAEFRQLRKRAAATLISKNVNDPEERESVLGVLNFFETLGFLFKNKIVNPTTVWHFFGSWLLPYYSASKSLVDSLRAKDPNLYIELDALYKAVCKVEVKMHPSKDTLHILSPEAIDEFLRTESALPITPRPSTA